MDAGGLRVLIVEDEALLAIDLEDILTDAGCKVVAAASRLEQAIEIAAATEFDLAILDMNLAGKRVDPLARRIADRGIPIIFVTGYGNRTLPGGVTAPVVDKPYAAAKLVPLVSAIAERLRAQDPHRLVARPLS